jgi:putative peptidoglycan lipid II flippase
MDDGLPVPAALADETRGIARNASIIALGNVTSRALGFVRDGIMAPLFGTGPHVDALILALTIPNQLNDLLTGGLVNSALVPVFSEYACSRWWRGPCRWWWRCCCWPRPRW